jgi:hypothetical protein
MQLQARFSGKNSGGFKQIFDAQIAVSDPEKHRWPASSIRQRFGASSNNT